MNRIKAWVILTPLWALLAVWVTTMSLATITQHRRIQRLEATIVEFKKWREVQNEVNTLVYLNIKKENAIREEWLKMKGNEK